MERIDVSQALKVTSSGSNETDANFTGTLPWSGYRHESSQLDAKSLWAL